MAVAMAGPASPTLALRETYREILDAELEAPCPEAAVQALVDERAEALAAEHSAFHATLLVRPVLESGLVETLTSVHGGITANMLEVLDLEVEGVRETLAVLGSQPTGDLAEVKRLQDALFDVGQQLLDPLLAPLLAQSELDREKVCRDLLSTLLELELRWSRCGGQLEILALQKELAELEKEDAEAKVIPPDPILRLYEQVTAHVEEASRALDRKESVVESTTPDSTPRPLTRKFTSSSIKQTMELAQISNPLFHGFDNTVALISQESGLDLTYVPGLKFRLGLADPPATPLIAVERELLARRYQSQLHYITQQRKTPDVAAAWNKAFGVIGFGGDDDNIVGITPSQTVSLRGFFITTQPIRLSDYKRLSQLPQYADKLRGLLSDATLQAYQWNYVPTFVNGTHFGFSCHRKDDTDDVDDPVLELPFFKAKQFAEALGGRLPTWQEWEAAARGEDAWLYPWGNTLDPEAVTFDAPVEWEVKYKTVQTRTSFLHGSERWEVGTGSSLRLARWGVYGYERSPFGLKSLARCGFEWNTANGDLGPNGPNTHLLRTLGDYYTQAVFEGSDEAKCGHHRAFSGPVLPLYAKPNRLTRTAAFRIVFVLPSDMDAEAGFTGPATAGPTNLCQVEALKLAREDTRDPDFEDLRSGLCVRVGGGGGGVMRGSSARLGFCVGRSLPPAQWSFPNLVLLLGLGAETALQLLGQPEEQTPHLFECGSNWSYYSLGVQVAVDSAARREVIRELQLYDSTADDLVTHEWNGYDAPLDLEGLQLVGLTVDRLAASAGWGPPHSQRAGVLFYLREYGDVMPQSADPGSRLSLARKQHATSALSFEFSARPDLTIAKVRVKLCR
eukprot:EG_transcript_2571